MCAGTDVLPDIGIVARGIVTGRVDRAALANALPDALEMAEVSLFVAWSSNRIFLTAGASDCATPSTRRAGLPGANTGAGIVGTAAAATTAAVTEGVVEGMGAGAVGDIMSKETVCFFLMVRTAATAWVAVPPWPVVTIALLVADWPKSISLAFCCLAVTAAATATVAVAAVGTTSSSRGRLVSAD